MDERELAMYFESRPPWLKANETAREKARATLEIDGKPYPYTICPREMQAGIRFFVGFPDKQHLFISDEVPESDRPHYLAHEVREFTDPKLKDKKGRCLEALKRELSEVPDNIRTEYIKRRLEMYQNLFTYLSGLADQEDEPNREKINLYKEMRAEVKQSLEHLQKISTVE